MENEEKEEKKEKEEKPNQKTILAFSDSKKAEVDKRNRPKPKLRKGSSVAILVMFSLSFFLLLAAIVLQILSIFGFEGIKEAYNTIVIVLVVMVVFSVLLAILLTKLDKNHTN